MLWIHRWPNRTTKGAEVYHVLDISTGDLMGLTGAVAIEEACHGKSLNCSAGQVGGDNFTIKPQCS